MFRLFRIGDQLVDRLAREDLVRQGDAPRSAGISVFEFKQKGPGKSKSKAIQQRHSIWHLAFSIWYLLNGSTV